MSAFLGISMWVALVTVVPGLVTIAAVYCAFVIYNPAIVSAETITSLISSDWISAGIAITIMVLTQAVGILLEEIIMRKELFPACSQLAVPQDFALKNETHINAYEQYKSLYILLAQLAEDEDTQGHLKRTAAQFFLTNNTLVSFITGIITALILALQFNGMSGELVLYALGLFVCLVVSYFVAIIRFRVMAKSIWATKIARIIRKQESVLETDG